VTRPRDGRRSARRAGLASIALGLVIAVAAPASAPRIWVWLLVALLAWGGVTVWVRNSTFRIRTLPRPGPSHLREVRDLGEPVRLTVVPNLPLAEMLCSELRQNGIEAFYKGNASLGGVTGSVAALNPSLPTDVWVGEADLEKARRFLP
jgi:hypothetical protein